MSRILTCLLTSFWCLTAGAATVTYQVTGTVNELERQGDFPMAEFAIGDTFLGTLTIDDATPDSSAITTFGDYQGAATAAHITIGSSSWEWTDTATSYVRVQLEDPVYGGEFVDILTHHDSGNGPVYAVWALQNVPDADALLTDSLDFPTSGFSIRYVDLFDTLLGPDQDHPYTRSLHARIELTTWQVVPIPATAWLFGSAIGALGWLRRQRPAN